MAERTFIVVTPCVNAASVEAAVRGAMDMSGWSVTAEGWTDDIGERVMVDINYHRSLDPDMIETDLRRLLEDAGYQTRSEAEDDELLDAAELAESAA